MEYFLACTLHFMRPINICIFLIKTFVPTKYVTSDAEQYDIDVNHVTKYHKTSNNKIPVVNNYSMAFDVVDIDDTEKNKKKWNPYDMPQPCNNIYSVNPFFENKMFQQIPFQIQHDTMKMPNMHIEILPQHYDNDDDYDIGLDLDKIELSQNRTNYKKTFGSVHKNLFVNY